MRTNYDQYLLYKLVQRGNSATKLPCNIAGDVVDAHDTQHHVDYDTAVTMADALGLGVAFALTSNDPYFLLDIDGAYDGQQWSDVATGLRGRFPGAYVEVSQSGRGLHIIGSYSGAAPEHKCKNIQQHLELYTSDRFIALGHTDTATGDPNCVYNDELARVIPQYFRPDALVAGGVDWTATPQGDARPIPNDDELIAKAMASQSANSAFGGTASFADLWTANAEKLAAVYPHDDKTYDESSADAALAAHLMFWTGADCERTDRLMRRSALARDKWDSHKSYMHMTLTGAASRAIARGDFYQAPEAVIERAAIQPCDKAIELGDTIQSWLEHKLNNVGEQVAEWEAVSIPVSRESIHQVITRSFWSGAKSKLFVLTNEGALNAYKREDMLRICQKHFGKLWDQKLVDVAIETYAAAMDITGAPLNALIKEVNMFAIQTITDHLIMHNQRERVDTRVDMFAEHPVVRWHTDKVTVVYPWQPLDLPAGDVEQQIITDYKDHFPQLDDILQQIVASRFASDRKKFYTWIRCGSDWGKGLFSAALTRLNLCVELSVSECEKAFEGAPLGREAIEFARAFVVMFNEFKSVKSELKQLENELPVTPKNQLKQSAEIFTKLFTSAETVDSLVGESGVEDQFANRFSYFEGGAAISSRPVFQQVGRRRYLGTITRYMAERITALVDGYLAMGRDEATDAADRFGDSFHQMNGISQRFSRLSESLPVLADDFIKWVWSTYSAGAMIDSPYLIIDGDDCYMRSANRLWADWVDVTYSRAEVGTIRKKRDEVFDVICDGGVKQRKVKSKNVKCLMFGRPGN